MEVRLNKLISDSGFCSRREADKVIEDGRVSVNGRTAVVGEKVKYNDKVRIDGQLIESKNDEVYIAFNKPAGVVSTTDPSERNNLLEYVNYPTRIFNVGRLDKESEGLIFLTNNGDIVNKILRAGNNHEKEYLVTVNKPITDSFIESMGSGVPIMGTMTRKCKVEKLSNKEFKIILTQGLNRQIRRMCEYFDYDVIRLIRVRIMNVEVKGLGRGEWRFLEEKELETLMQLVESSAGTVKSSKKKTVTTSPTSTESKKEPKTYTHTRGAKRVVRPKRHEYDTVKTKENGGKEKEGKPKTTGIDRRAKSVDSIEVVDRGRRPKVRAANPKSVEVRSSKAKKTTPSSSTRPTRGGTRSITSKRKPNK